MKKFLLYLFLLFIGTVAYAQQKDALLDEYNTIRKKSIDTSVSPKELKMLSDQYLEKVKTTNQDKYIGRGFYLQSLATKEVQQKTQYLDSAIHYTKQLENDKKFPMRAYVYKANILFYEKDYQKALDELILAEHAAIKSENTLFQRSIKYNIGILKRFLGAYGEAETLFLECKMFEENREKMHVGTYINILFQLSSVYLELKKTDECTEINLQGIRLTKENNNKKYHSFVSNEGMNLSIIGNYAASIDSLEKSYGFLKVSDQNFANFYLGKSYYTIGEKEKGISYFKKIDTAFNTTNDLYPSLLSAYPYLIKDSKEMKDKELQLYYTNQLLKVDSIVDKNYEYLSNTIIKKYEVPKLLVERDDIIKILQDKNRTVVEEKTWIIIVSFFICLFALAGFVYNYRLKRIYERRYEAIVNSSKTVIIEEINVQDTNLKPRPSINIDESIIQEISQALEIFEEGEAYLKNQISLKDVAKIVNTNSKYLSKIINSYKGKNFTTYINDLRIDYLVSHIQTDTKYQKYTIRAIAEEIGFSNPEGFSRAFQKKTGLKPSYFIKKVRESTQKKQ